MRKRLSDSLQQLDAWIQAGEWEEARAASAALVKEAPLTPGVHERAIVVLRELEDWPALTALLMEGRNRYQLWIEGSDLLMGQGLVEMGEWSQAIPYLKQVVEQGSSEGWPHHFLGKALRHTGCFEEALAQQRLASEQLPDFAWAPFEAAQVLLQLERPQLAVLEMQEARRRSAEPNEVIESEWQKLQPVVLAQRVDELVAAGQITEGLSVLREAVIQRPDDEALQERLNQLLLSAFDPAPSGEGADESVLMLERELNAIEGLLDQLEGQQGKAAAIKMNEWSYL